MNEKRIQTACDNLATIHGLANVMEEKAHQDGNTDYFSLAAAIKGLANEGLESVMEVQPS